MEYLHKIINFLDGTTNQTHKYSKKTDDTKTGSSDVADQITFQNFNEKVTFM